MLKRLNLPKGWTIVSGRNVKNVAYKPSKDGLYLRGPDGKTYVPKLVDGGENGVIPIELPQNTSRFVEIARKNIGKAIAYWVYGAGVKLQASVRRTVEKKTPSPDALVALRSECLARPDAPQRYAGNAELLEQDAIELWRQRNKETDYSKKLWTELC